MTGKVKFWLAKLAFMCWGIGGGWMFSQDTTAAYTASLTAKNFLKHGNPRAALAEFDIAYKGYEAAGMERKAIDLRNRKCSAMLHLGMWETVDSELEIVFKKIEDGGFENTTLKGAALFNKAARWYHVGQFRKAMEYFEESLEVLDKSPDARPEHVNTTFGMLGSCYYMLGNYSKALEYTQAALDANIEALGPDHPFVATGWMNTGAVYFDMGNFEEGLRYFLEAYRIVDEQGTVNDPTLKENLLQNIGSAYGFLGEYDVALAYYDKAIDLKTQTLGPGHPEFSTIWGNYGAICLKKGDSTQSLVYTQRALDLARKSFGDQHPQVPSMLGNKAELMNMMGKYEEAVSLLEEAILLNEKLEEAPFPSNTEMYLRRGKALHQLGRNEEAEQDFLKSIEIAQQAYQDRGPKAAGAYMALAEFYQETQAPEKVWEYSDASIRCMIQPGERETSGNWNVEQIADLPIVLRGVKARMEAELHHPEVAVSPESHLEKSFRQAQFGLTIIDSMRKRHISPESRNDLGKTSSTLLEKGIEIGLQLYEDKPQEAGGLFEMVERGKGNLLSAALNDIKARRFAGVPDSILQLERQLKNDLAFFQKKLISEPDTSERAIMWRDQVFRIKQELVRISDRLHNDYPSYFDLKYDVSAPDVNQMMAWCRQHNSAVIEFYCGDSLGAVFCFTPNDWGLYPISNYQQEEHKAEELSREIRKNPSGTPNAELWSKFAGPARAVYQTWIEPAEELIGKLSSIVIIPDGKLTSLPFEVLLTGDPGKSENFAGAPYWFRKNSLHYAYSAKSLFQEGHPGNPSEQVLAMAPDFSGNSSGPEAQRDGVGSLPYAAKEVDRILHSLEGTALVGTSASETSFREKANQYGIIHLATHGLLDDERPMYSRILMTADSVEDGMLHTYELFNLELNADLAVLSACNTGVGKFQRGEGVMSLARGFAFAGCPAIVMSLWEVDDLATSEIMALFYEGLSRGDSKDIALQQARLNYLSGASGKRAHPYFWAGLVQIGDAKPVAGKGNTLLWVILGALALGVGGLIWREAS